MHARYCFPLLWCYNVLFIIVCLDMTDVEAVALELVAQYALVNVGRLQR